VEAARGPKLPGMRAQRMAIAAQGQLLTELAGTDYKATARFEFVPGIALQADWTALKILERS
jgi:hypothetical protein